MQTYFGFWGCAELLINIRNGMAAIFFYFKEKKKKKVRIGSDVLLFPKLKIRLRNKYRPQMISISTRTSRKI